MRLLLLAVTLLFSYSVEASFIKWCQDKLSSKTKNKTELEAKSNDSEKTLRTIEQVLELTKYELDRPLEEVAKINQAKELYYKIQELHSIWSEKDTTHGIALKTRNIVAFGNQRKNIFHEINSDLNQNKENIEKLPGGFTHGQSLLKDLQSNKRSLSSLSNDERKLFSEITLRDYLEFCHAHFSQAEDWKAIELLHIENQALIAQLDWLTKRKDLLDLVNSISGVEVKGNDELETKIKETKKLIERLHPRIQEMILRHEKEQSNLDRLEQTVQSLMNQFPELKKEFIYSAKVEVKSKITGDSQVIQFYVRAYDDRGNRQSKNGIEIESKTILEQLGLRSF